MWAPSTSASASTITLWYRAFSPVKSSPIPAPIAWTSTWISSFFSIRSMRDRSTLRIFPRIGRMAWKRGSRARLAEPPALSPSTMKSSDSAGSFDEQSASLPGIAALSSNDLRRVRSRAWRAAARAREAWRALLTMRRPSLGCSSSQSLNFSFVARSTEERISVLPSLAFVWPSNWGERNFTETIAVRPSRMSSPSRFESLSFRRPFDLPYLFKTFVRAFLKPSSCMPPSVVAMLFAKECRPS